MGNNTIINFNSVNLFLLFILMWNIGEASNTRHILPTSVFVLQENISEIWPTHYLCFFIPMPLGMYRLLTHPKMY